jgi:hypothetical protein
MKYSYRFTPGCTGGYSYQALLEPSGDCFCLSPGCTAGYLSKAHSESEKKCHRLFFSLKGKEINEGSRIYLRLSALFIFLFNFNMKCDRESQIKVLYKFVFQYINIAILL